MSNFYLYFSLLKTLVQLLPAADAARLINLTLMVLALSQSHNCHLATLVTVWPIFGKRTSLIQRARRWLSNRYLSQRIYYMPLVKRILDNWEGSEIALSMDRTDIKNKLSILVVGVCYKKRALSMDRITFWFN